VVILEINKIIKLKINGENENSKEIEKLLTTWRYSVMAKKKRNKH
jgi:hypothetical protein